MSFVNERKRLDVLSYHSHAKKWMCRPTHLPRDGHVNVY